MSIVDDRPAMFRFRFHALLAIRRREERLRQSALARALAEERTAGISRSALADEAENVRRSLAESMRRVCAVSGRGGDLLALVAHLARVDERAAVAAERYDRAVRARVAASARLEEAAQPRRALERLEATERERYELVLGRAEEAELGDANALQRRSRRG